ncbi:MAG: DUF975 family protein [Eubacteriales bacterium]|nr:DUF975 family protein [Eubacteriales bacterium]
MWTRSELKTNAKKSLTGSYWMALLVTVIAGILAGNSSYFSYQLNDRDFDRMAGMNWAWADWAAVMDSVWVRLILAAVSLAALIAILFRIFFSTVIEAGEARWFSRNRESKPTPSLGQLFGLFRADTWLPTVGAMFWMYLWLWIWSLLPLLAFAGAGITLGLYLGLMNPLQLPASWDFGQHWSQQWNWNNRPGQFQDWENQFGEFFANNQSQIAVIAAVAVGTLLLATLLSIPWINRSYAYRQTRWILGDNPRIGYRRALRLSRQMMKGHKFDTFVLDLSFIGWYILGLLAFVIGVVFVAPYYRATQAELYAVLRRNAVSQGLATMEDFGFLAISQPGYETGLSATATDLSTTAAGETTSEPSDLTGTQPEEKPESEDT